MYTAAFEKAIDHAMLYEVGGFWKLTPEVEAGLISTPAQRKAVGYTNDPLDAGGETKFGVAKTANLSLNIAILTWAQAKAVYYEKYWLKGSCDKIPGRIAALHFDGCVNHGVERANKFLQRAVGAVDDGSIGPKTLASINSKNEISVCTEICNQREKFYRDIVAAKPTQVRFLNGWLRRINEMREFSTNPKNTF